ncbi:hypothetical protein LVO79_02375 [Roseivivax marinus]|uniref:hypothetical protein n=1 Tax=Roseivivax marinus TaxID=1379903 RepID=UPI001F03961C|nr:hypothetical protein [Roseivivax marinus]UMA65333.1 hypothetical protein LVO79_02375 [Roseivivax marinus]
MTEYLTAISAWTKANPNITVAIIALCGVLISAFVAFITGKRSVYISSVTAERSKWIDKLRGNIAEFVGVCSAIHLHIPIDGDYTGRTTEQKKADIERRHQADCLIALITLQLNPNEKSGIDKNIILHMEKLAVAAENADKGYRSEERKFVRHCQFLLKEEWEKVKSEALGPIKSKLTFQGCKAKGRRDDYLAFRASELPHLSQNNRSSVSR